MAMMAKAACMQRKCRSTEISPFSFLVFISVTYSLMRSFIVLIFSLQRNLLGKGQSDHQENTFLLVFLGSYFFYFSAL